MIYYEPQKTINLVHTARIVAVCGAIHNRVVIGGGVRMELTLTQQKTLRQVGFGTIFRGRRLVSADGGISVDGRSLKSLERLGLVKYQTWSHFGMLHQKPELTEKGEDIFESKLRWLNI